MKELILLLLIFIFGLDAMNLDYIKKKQLNHGINEKFKFDRIERKALENTQSKFFRM